MEDRKLNSQESIELIATPESTMPSAEIFVSRVSARIKSATAMLPTNAITGTRTPEYAEAPAFRTMTSTRFVPKF